mmetsp:Transcript_49150/g.114948  ORF Transcript_49150/g.114948 Transcript_49150/m.114948 type:complete len:629 (-) Transcript_49150:75-1961(-)
MSTADDDLTMALALSQAANPEVVEKAYALATLPKPKLEKCLKIVTTLLQNLVKEPDNAKYRSVRLSNAKIQAAVVEVSEAMELMLACGFSKQEDQLVAGDGAEAKAAEALESILNATAEFQLSAELSHGSAVRCICAMPDGSVVTGAMDNVVRHFPDNASAPRCFAGHARTSGVDGVLAVCCSTGGNEVASGGRDGKVIVWDVPSGQPQKELLGHGESSDVTNARSIGALCCSGDGIFVSGGWDKTARVWEDSPRILSSHTHAVNGVCLLEGGVVVTASGDGSLRIWPAAASAPSQTCAAQSPARAVCSVGESGVAFASTHNDGHMRTWSTGECKQMHAVQASSSYLFTVAYSVRLKLLASGGDDGAVKVWTLMAELVQTIQHPMEVYGVCFAENGDLFTACGDQFARVWTRDSQRSAPTGVKMEFNSKVAAVLAAQSSMMDTSGPAAAPSAGQSWDFEHAVELEGGKKMTLRWNRGERPEDVANRFLSENGLPANHFADVLAFVSQAQGAASGPAMGGGQSDFNYPVEVADGRRLTISWNRGEDPMQVAQRFASQHQIPINEVQDIAGFVRQVSGSPVAPSVAQAPVTVSAESVMMMLNMGFEESRAREALQATGGNVEAAIQRLLG